MFLKKSLMAVILLLMGAFFWQVGSYYLSTESWVKVDQITRTIFPYLPEGESMTTGLFSDSKCLSQELVKNTLVDLLEIDPANELGLFGSEDSIVKWRENENEPYRGYPLESANEYIVPEITVEKYDLIIGDGQSIVRSLGSDWEVYTPMNIPVYRYPSGELARKIGIKRGNERFLIGIFATSAGEKSATEDAHVKIYCTEPEAETVNLYNNYVSITHEYPSETSVTYTDLGNNLGKFSLLYPGSPSDYEASEFWDTSSKPWIKIYEIGQFPPCKLFEKLKIGMGSGCYLPEKKQFSVINY